MNQELELKLQAWVDGELSEAEARHITQLAAADSEGARLAAELRAISAAMSGAELIRAVPETREFYWSKIQRQIEAEARPTPLAPRTPFWRRLLMPMTGLAAACCVMLLTLKQSAPAPANYDEVTATSDAMDTMTYHDQSTGLTVVWLQDKAAAQPNSDHATDIDNSVETD